MDETYIPLEEVIAKLVNALKEEGSILFAQVPGRLKPIDYKQYSGKQGLKTWLLSFPEFTESEDGLSLELVAPVAPIPAEEEDETGYSIWEVRCMHAFAYMNYWNQNLKQLRSLGEFADLKVDSLRDRIAHTLMHDIFSGELSMDFSDPQNPRLFLNTDLVLPNGHPVYGVLCPNPANLDGSKQFWVMKGFGSTSESDTSELGNWLRSYFGVAAALDYAELSARMDSVAQMMETIKGETAAFLTSLDAETCPVLTADSQFSHKIAQYEQQWQTLLEAVEGFIPLHQDAPVTLSQLRAATNKESLRSSLLTQALDTFDTMSQGVQQFFSDSRWSNEETGTPRQDSLRLRSCYMGGTAALSEFQTTLDAYRCLRDVMASQQADDAHYEKLDAVKAHFTELPSLRNASRMLIATPLEERQFLENIQQIDQLLAQYLASQEAPKAPEQKIPLPEPGSALLAEALRADTEYQRNWPSYLKAALPAEDAIRALVTPEADPPQELTCYAAAMRLLAAGEAAYGERYLILGLEHEATRCVPELLKLYRENNRVEDFEALWNRFHDSMSFSPEDDFFWFGVICVRSPEQALTMAQANIQLQYQRAYLTHLIPAAEVLGNMQLAETFRERLTRMDSNRQPDTFEAAVISGDPSAIEEVAQEEFLQTLGFSPRQIKSICSTAESGEYPTGTDAYEVGCRCFRFQGNRNALAEQWMWQGISKQSRFSYGELLCLLTIEHRWDEVIALFESNAEIQKRFEVSRRFYLIARFHASPLEARSALSENLQDILLLMNLQEEYREDFFQVSQNPGHEFYASLCKLYDAVSHPYLWSVVCEDRSLRERVVDQAQMGQLGLDVAKISETYRSGKYPHGTDAADISARLYALAGNLGSAAETAALLATGDTSAQLLWTIYSDEQNESAMYDLLVRYPWLRQEHPDEYLDFLYARREYAAFLDALSPDDNLCDNQILQRATAQLHTRQPLTDSPQICAEAALTGKPALCLGLLTAAGQQNQADLVAAILCSHFEQWISLEPQQLEELVSCGRCADPALLEAVQAAALENGPVSLAVYLHNHLHIGSIPEQAQALYLQLQEELESTNTENWTACIRKLRYLYPNQVEILSPRAVSTSIGTLLKDNDPDHRKDNAERLHTILQALGDDPSLFETVTQLLTGSEYCWDYRVYTSIYEYGQRMSRLPDALVLLHSAAGIPGAEKKLYFRDYLMKFYYNALALEIFPIQIAREAEELCFQAVEQGSSSLAALCIYMLELLCQRPIYADAVLNYLIMGEDALSESPQEALQQQGITELPAWLVLDRTPPTGLDLFEKLLETSTHEEDILEYLRFCNRFVRGNIGALQELRNLSSEQQMLSEQHSILAIDLLCSAPETSEYWEICTHIPFDIDVGGRLRFLHLCCQKQPGHWDDYVKLCETPEADCQLLAPALAAWANAPGPHAQKCRLHIEYRLNQDADYLARLEDGNSLCQMVTHMCRQLQDASQNWNHAQIAAVVFIAVSTGQPECLKILLRDAGHLLLGSKADLGVVVVSRLLRGGRIEEAAQWISYLHDSPAVIKYSALIETLCRMDEAQLRNWCAQPGNLDFLGILLPDGNQPNVNQITKLTADALMNGTAAEAATILANLMRIFPDDHVTSYSLLELCRTGFEGSIPLLHRALVNLLLMQDPKENTHIFYDRFRDAHTISLAILHQVIIARNEMDTIQGDWDFQLSVAQNLENAGAAYFDRDLLKQVTEAFQDSLVNRRDQIKQRRIEAWLANVTGDWTKYLHLAYTADPADEEVFFPVDNISSAGVIPSVLRFLHQAGPEDRPDMVKWLKSLPMGTTRQQQLKAALYLQEQGTVERLYALEGIDADTILRFPFENYGLFQKFGEYSLPDILDKGVGYAEPVAHILCACGGSGAVFSDMRTRAAGYFDNGQDDMAWCFYAAMYTVAPRLAVSHSSIGRGRGPGFYRNVEEYQARMRVTGAFSGQEDILIKLRDPDLSAWSVINLVLSLAVDKARRVDEIQRLCRYLAPERASLAQKVQLFLTSTVPDSEKLAVIRDISLPEMDRYYLSKLLKHPHDYKNPVESIFLEDLQSAVSADAINRSLYNRYKGSTEEKKYKHMLLLQELNRNNIEKRVQQQITTQWATAQAVPFEKALYVYVAPAYAADLAPIPGSEKDLSQLQQQYNQLILSNPHGLIPEKAALSQEIYCRTLALENNDIQRYQAMVRYSVDRFYLLVNGKTPDSAVDLLIPLLETDNSGVPRCPELEAMADMFNSAGATKLLRSYIDIRSMVQDYADHKPAFLKMKNLLQDPVAVRDIEVIYRVLDKLSAHYSLGNDPDIDQLLKALEDVDRMIGNINGIGWLAVRGQLQRLIRTERNLLSRRPILDIQLMNRGKQSHQGYFHGIVVNKGTVAAESLTLQAFCGDPNGSNQYTLDRIMPNGKVIFEIPYSASQDAELLTGYLDLVGKSGKSTISQRKDFQFNLGQTSGEDLLYNTYNTDKPGQFVYDPETGTVKNDRFFGRSDETAQMRELVAGDNFADYHSAVVYGVRRTGKTSLLEYFRAYVRGSRPDCLCIRIDVQMTDETIQSVFVDSVLQEETVQAALEQSGDRDAFTEAWSRSFQDREDLNPSMLKSFFKELKKITGKGLILIIDEIDRLFKRLIDDHMEASLNGLLKAISGILDDEDAREYLHLVMCGSNWLMYYASMGNDMREMQQVFHRLGDYKIAVGRLPKEDVMELLHSAKVNYTEEALEMIWEYTGGLVWFVKLFGNAAIRRAKSHNRSWVYPADVFYSLYEVLCDRNCEQFYEGCTPGGLERPIIDVMQAMAFRKDMYLSIDKICQRLGRDVDDVERAIAGLIRFDIAKRNPANPDTVRFSLDIYRRYFRTVNSSQVREPEEPAVFERKVQTNITPQASYNDDELI